MSDYLQGLFIGFIGAHISFLIGNKIIIGYWLPPEICRICRGSIHKKAGGAGDE